jgi:tetratricopeptide (TPR) repeat protein
MAQAFESTPGMLGDRLLAALDAGQAAGGDSRGMQSAALLIVRAGGGYGGFNDRYCDLRVDDAVDPFREIRRLYNLWKPNALILEGYTACEAGDFERAFKIGSEAVRIDSSSGESQYHLACYYSKAGRSEDALKWLAEAVRLDPRLGPRASTDSDFTPLRDDARFMTLTGSPDPNRK